MYQVLVEGPELGFFSCCCNLQGTSSSVQLAKVASPGWKCHESDSRLTTHDQCLWLNNWNLVLFCKILTAPTPSGPSPVSSGSPKKESETGKDDGAWGGITGQPTNPNPSANGPCGTDTMINSVATLRNRCPVPIRKCTGPPASSCGRRCHQQFNFGGGHTPHQKQNHNCEPVVFPPRERSCVPRPHTAGTPHSRQLRSDCDQPQRGGGAGWRRRRRNDCLKGNDDWQQS